MIDREKVIKGLECCLNVGDCQKQCDYFPDNGCDKELMRDALELLKAQDEKVVNLTTKIAELTTSQEPVAPIHIDKYTRTEPITFEYKCTVCCSGLMKHWVCCPNCGTEVKWDG